MKNIYFIILTIGVALLVALSIFNIYVSFQNERKIDEKIIRAVMEQDKKDAHLKELIFKALEQPQTIQGEKGDPGKDAYVDYDVVREIVKEEVKNNPPEKGESGQKGNDGKDGLNARTPIFDTIEGMIVFKYEGDDMWTVLVDVCEVTVCK
jgi:hypothetical protein